jgi:hypothetical protein
MKAGHSPNIERATRRIASAFGYGSCWSDGGKRPNANIEAADFGESPACCLWRRFPRAGPLGGFLTP